MQDEIQIELPNTTAPEPIKEVYEATKKLFPNCKIIIKLKM